VLSLSEAAPLVAARGRAMQQAAPPGSGRMAAVFGLPVDQVEAACAASSRPGEPACVATNNSAEQTVISGAAAAVERAGQELTRRGGVVHPLKISIPAHSPLMAPAARALEEALDRVTVREAAWPVLANATNEPCREPAAIRSSLIQQLTRPVRWRQAMETLVQSGVQWVLEAGPRTVLRDLFKLEHPRVVAFSAGDPEGVKAVQAFLRARVSAGGEPQRVRFLARCLAIAAATRNTSTDPQRYALTVVEPHRKLREIRRVAGESGTADDAALREAAELLRRILRGKGVPEPERRASLDALRTETCTQALLPDLEP
jgi:[acyl-carrier-protein] S-malonyltransferase